MAEKREQREKLTEAQQSMAQLEVLGAQSRELQRQHLEISSRVEEVENAIHALAEIKKTKAGADTLVPLGAGVFARGTLAEVAKVLVNVGAGVIVEKDVAAAKSTLEEQQKLLKGAAERVEQELAKISRVAEELYGAIQMRQLQG